VRGALDGYYLRIPGKKRIKFIILIKKIKEKEDNKETWNLYFPYIFFSEGKLII
jgi:hypothetical protein